MKVSFFPSVGLHPWQRYSRIFWNYQVSDYVKINTEEKTQLERRGAAGLDTCWFNPRAKLNIQKLIQPIKYKNKMI